MGFHGETTEVFVQIRDYSQSNCLEKVRWSSMTCVEPRWLVNDRLLLLLVLERCEMP